MITCKKCQTQYKGNFCPNCGTAHSLRRINGHYILSEISSVLNFDRGFLYTIRELVIRPGISVRKFIEEDRNRLVKPIIFLVLSSLIYTIIQQLMNFEDGYIKAADMGESTTARIFEWIQANYGYANLILGLFVGLWSKALFRKSPYNIYEILILIFFIMGVGMLFFAAFGLIEGISGWNVLQFGSILSFIYLSWAIGNFFERGKVLGIVKGFAAYILGMISFVVLIFPVGYIIDQIRA